MTSLCQTSTEVVSLTEENECNCHRLVNAGSDIQADESCSIGRVLGRGQVKPDPVEQESKKETKKKEREVVWSC